MVYFAIFLLGLSLGSFVNALVWRIYMQSQAASLRSSVKKTKKFEANDRRQVTDSYSILKGGSMCTYCKHELSAADLVPVLSWLWLRGRCRYCKKAISKQYPLVELLTGFVFVASFWLWGADLSLPAAQLLLGTWLLSSVGLIALAVYDVKWMILPSRIIYPTLLLALIGKLTYIIFYSTRPLHDLWLMALSIAVASGFFWLLFELSKGEWIGFGDVRLGLITGTLIANPLQSVAMIFIASLLGTLVILPSLIRKNKGFGSKIPFGPFLIVATGIMVVYGDRLVEIYQNLFI